MKLKRYESIFRESKKIDVFTLGGERTYITIEKIGKDNYKAYTSSREYPFKVKGDAEDIGDYIDESFGFPLSNNSGYKIKDIESLIDYIDYRL